MTSDISVGWLSVCLVKHWHLPFSKASKNSLHLSHKQINGVEKLNTHTHQNVRATEEIPRNFEMTRWNTIMFTTLSTQRRHWLCIPPTDFTSKRWDMAVSQLTLLHTSCWCCECNYKSGPGGQLVLEVASSYNKSLLKKTKLHCIMASSSRYTLYCGVGMTSSYSPGTHKDKAADKVEKQISRFRELPFFILL